MYIAGRPCRLFGNLAYPAYNVSVLSFAIGPKFTTVGKRRFVTLVDNLHVEAIYVQKTKSS